MAGATRIDPDITLLEEVGRGEGGVVFRAMRGHSPCLVKVPGEQPKHDGRTVTTFVRNAAALARVGGTGLPRILLVQTEGETPYVVMERVQAVALRTLVQRGLSPSDFLALATKLSSGIARLHAEGFRCGRLGLDGVLMNPQRREVYLLDRGHLTRLTDLASASGRLAVDDARASDRYHLGQLLDTCMPSSEHWREQSATLAAVRGILDELCDRKRVDLASVAARFCGLADGGSRRASSYPPPLSQKDVGVSPTKLASRAAAAHLVRAWEGTRRGSGALLELVGPTGSGKTHLLAGFAEQLSEEGRLVLYARCSSTDWNPFAAVRRLLEAHAGGFCGLPAERRQELVEHLQRAAGPMSPYLRLLSPKLGAVLGGPSETPSASDPRDAFVEGVAEFLSRYLTACGPAVLLVDDCQWLDGSSQQLLARVAQQIASSCALLLCVHRGDEAGRAAAEAVFKLAEEERVSRVCLGPLQRAEVAAMVCAYLGEVGQPSEHLVDALVELGDGTPRSLVDLLHEAVESGYLLPCWGSWQLSGAGLAALRRRPRRDQTADRFQGLSADAMRVLGACAVAGQSATAATVAKALESDADEVRRVLESAAVRRIVGLGPRDEVEFLHDGLRSAALKALPAAERPLLHSRIARALERHPTSTAGEMCELARHYAQAGDLAPAVRAYEVGLQAVEGHMSRGDAARALELIGLVESAAARAGIPLGTETHLQAAEARLRTGDREGSLRSFEEAFRLSKGRVERAHALGRMAWVWALAADPARARGLLSRAFAELDESSPGGRPVSLPAALFRLVLARPWRKPDDRVPVDQRVALLWVLHSQSMRVAMEAGEPRRALVSIIEMARLACKLPIGVMRVRSHATNAFILWQAGFRRLAKRQQRLADRLAERLRDPVSLAACLRTRHVIAAWTDRYDEALSLAADYDAGFGHWEDLDNYCDVIMGVYLLEVALGRPQRALVWLERLLERASRQTHAPAILAVLEPCLTATLTTLGRPADLASYKKRLELLNPPALVNGGFYHLLSLVVRVQCLAEAGSLGEEFERVWGEFRTCCPQPARAHAALKGYFGHIAHARVHQCLRAPDGELSWRLPLAERAVRDFASLQVQALGKCHARVLQAHVHWFRGAREKAHVSLEASERLARELGCVWVLISAARLRAHMLMADGCNEAAHDQAAIALAIARRHGHECRAQWILEEFPQVLRSSSEVSKGDEASRKPPTADVSQQWTALLRISRTASWELSRQRQSELVLDEIAAALDADRGFLFLRHAESGEPEQVAEFTGADTAVRYECDRQLIEQVYGAGQPVLTELVERAPDGHGIAIHYVMSVPLALHGDIVGVCYVDRSPPKLQFDGGERELLRALGSQVPVALQLADTLRDRERLEGNLRQAQKMEAIGRLAGGIAHDFNNILATIQVAAGTLADRIPAEAPEREELDDILDVADRGAALTKQLLTFARREPTPPRPIDLNAVIQGLLPMLTRLVGIRIPIRTELDASLPTVTGDTTRVEQVIMNLVTNARDALADGGEITITTRALAEPGEAHVAAGLGAGPHAVMTVADNGSGMSGDVMGKIFDPFFTTKAHGQGTGLGLSTVYGIIKDAQGHIDVESAPGEGTRIDTIWPATDLPLETPETLSTALLPASGVATLLVVDDDVQFCRTARRALSSAGYRVLMATDAERARALFARHRDEVRMVVAAVRMDNLDARTLIGELRREKPSLPALCMSGDAAADLVAEGVLDSEIPFMRKPFAAPALTGRVREILAEANAQGPGASTETSGSASRVFKRMRMPTNREP